MKRYAITEKRKKGYIIPTIAELFFDSPFHLGSYCASNGSLWVSLDDGKSIFKTKAEAEARLQEIITELLS